MPKNKTKTTEVFIEEDEEPSNSEPEQIVVKTRRKKKKPESKKQPQVIYISQSELDEDESDYYDVQPSEEPTDPFAMFGSSRVLYDNRMFPFLMAMAVASMLFDLIRADFKL